MWGKLWELCSPAQLRRFLLGDGAQDLRKMAQPKERTPDLPSKRVTEDTSQTDGSCLITAGNMDPRYFQNTYFLYSFTSTNQSCL